MPGSAEPGGGPTPRSRNPSEGDVRPDVEALIAAWNACEGPDCSLTYKERNHCRRKLVSLSKADGQSGTAAGVPTYVLEFVAEEEFTEDCFVHRLPYLGERRYFRERRWDPERVIPKGERRQHHGRAKFARYESGWKREKGWGAWSYDGLDAALKRKYGGTDKNER